MASAREAFIETTARLLETQGYSATGLNQIVAESGAPKGSLYYYFPDGKEGLTIEVINRVGRLIAERIRVNLATIDDPAEAISTFISTIARYVEASDCRGGGPIATVALETASTSERLREACNTAYHSWQDAFVEKLSAGGYEAAQAVRLSRVIVALIEGATILSRAKHNASPLEDAAEEVRVLLHAHQ